jgi:hypothetical protein
MDASGEVAEFLLLLVLNVQTLGFETNLCSGVRDPGGQGINA